MMTLEELDAQIKELQAERRRLAAEKGRPLLYEGIKSTGIFDDGRIGSVRWVQYVPAFNDGDPCEFTVSFRWFNFGFDGYDFLNEDDDGFNSWNIEYYLGRLNLEDKPKWHTDEQWRREIDRAQQQVERIKSLGWTLELAQALKETERAVSRWLNDHEDFLKETFGWPHQITVFADGRFEEDDYDCGY